MEIYNSTQLLNRKIRLHKEKGFTTGFVATMGALHRGHLSLLDCCKKDNDLSIVSIFVNPTQFNDPDDLKRYPRTLDKDLELLKQQGCDIVFCPSEQEIYPEPDNRVFDLGSIGSVMEAVHRPGHFNGVAQVVTRLFDITTPDRAYFGIKDFQQIAVIKKVSLDMLYNIEIVVCPTVREDDGLAMSSRNALLTPEQRKAAASISDALFEAKSLVHDHQAEWIKQFVIDRINSNPLLQVEYFEIVDEVDLQPVNDFSKPAYGCIAVRIGKIRLIDNVCFSL
jgi:pantoate--beta-alanine ligase